MDLKKSNINAFPDLDLDKPLGKEEEKILGMAFVSPDDDIEPKKLKKIEEKSELKSAIGELLSMMVNMQPLAAFMKPNGEVKKQSFEDVKKQFEDLMKDQD